MYLFSASSSDEMACKVYDRLGMFGYETTSRNGNVIRLDGPVIMEYTDPKNRANFTSGRNANPFFHIAEAIWMLAGRRDVEFLTKFNSNMGKYSDDGEVFNAAYGYRLRKHFGFDQLRKVLIHLKNTPESRQAVCQLWDPRDLDKVTKDKACNTQMVFAIVNHRLELTVFNRSNDAIFGGVTGANPVHFSFFQQWMADQLDIEMGSLFFVSNNLHVYTDNPLWVGMTPSPTGDMPPPYIGQMGTLRECERICDDIMGAGYVRHATVSSPYMRKVVQPILNAWMLRKEYNDSKQALQLLDLCKDVPLEMACKLWIRRADAKKGN